MSQERESNMCLASSHGVGSQAWSSEGLATVQCLCKYGARRLPRFYNMHLAFFSGSVIGMVVCW